MGELWDFAKQIAQSDGRKNDWVYIVTVYKSIGGREVVMEISGLEGRYEVLGEASPSLVLVSDKNGEVTTLEKSVIKGYRKKFNKRDVESVDKIKKSVLIEGKTYNLELYISTK